MRQRHKMGAFRSQRAQFPFWDSIKKKKGTIKKKSQGGIAPLVAMPLLAFVLPESRQLQNARRATGPNLEAQQGFLFALFGGGRTTRTLLLWLGFFLALLTMYLLLNWLPSLLVSRGMTQTDASIVQLSFNLLGALGSVSTGLLMDRVSLGKVVMNAFGSAALCILLLSRLTPELTTAVMVGGLVGISMSATQAVLYALAPSGYPTEIRGTGVGSAVAVGRLGSAVGPLLAAALLTSGRTPQQVLQMLVPVMLAAGAAVLILVSVVKLRPLPSFPADPVDERNGK